VKSDLLKYKHYFVLLAALLLANFLVVPFWQVMQEQKQDINLLSTHELKLNTLIANSSRYQDLINKAEQNKQEIHGYVFTQASEAKFKLTVQQKLEALFAEAKCSVQRINWKSATPVSEGITSWTVQTRFKGNPACMIKITRAFGETKPLLRVQDFIFSSRKINGQVRNKINAVVELFVLHIPTKVSSHVDREANKEVNNQGNNEPNNQASNIANTEEAI
jgi:hypothetical protein